MNSLWQHVVSPEDPIRTAHLKMGGFAMRCDLRQFLQRQFYFFGTYWLEDDVLDCWGEFARNARVILDVGANVGIFSLAALAVRADATAHAFEPTPDIARVLRDTAALNSLMNLHVHEVAVTRRSGIAHLNFCRGRDGANEGMNFVTTSPKAGKTLPIRTVSLDDFCAEHEVERVDLLKLDIQGNEAEALAGAERMFQDGRVRTVFTELNWGEQSGAVCAASESIGFLSRHGFDFSEPKLGASFRAPGDWMQSLTDIVARRRARAGDA